MLGVTVFGLVFTPLFYVLVDKLGTYFAKTNHDDEHGDAPKRPHWWQRLRNLMVKPSKPA